MFKQNLLILAFIFVFSSCSAQKSALTHVKHEVPDTKEEKHTAAKPKNIILLIGDGMGTAELFAAMTVNGGKANIMRFSYSGFSQTQSADDYVTDSAAGGTAISTGKRTSNGTIAMDTLGNKLTTILELAENAGIATGLISTSAITHATPASFIAHEENRNSYEAIAADFLETDIDLFIGGGLKHFDSRKDGRKLTEELEQKGYSIFTDWESINYESDKIAALIAPKHPDKYLDGRGDYLPQTTEKAIEHLAKKDKGFFIMIEGSQIDWGGHANNINYIVSETLDFDRAVGKALDFAEKDGETLVIVTADHETGGLTLPKGNMKEGYVDAKFSTLHHSAVMVPVFSYGPGAEIFSGIQKNTDLNAKMLKLLNLN